MYNAGKVLILGGNRFMGKALAKRIIWEYRYNQVDVFNRSGTNPWGTNIIQGDRNNLKDLKKIKFDEYDCIVDMCLYKIAQLKLILPHIRSKKYIFMSSIAAMLDPENRNFNEYGQQKHLIEAILLENVHQCIIIRPTYVLSSPGIPSHHPRDSYFLNCLYNNVPIQLQGDGSAELSFIFAKDVVSVLIDSICARRNDKELNLASEPISVVDLIGLFEKHAGRKAKLIFDSTRGPFDNKRYVFPESTPLICLTKLDDGIKELIKCFEIEGNN